MMRICPKCGDFYADGSLAFCLIDGTPLAGVAPDSEVWSKGVRVVEEKASTLRRHGRTQKWRRVLFSVTTTLVITTVVCVVALNSLIYLRPMPEERIPTEPLALAPPPTGPGDSTFPITEPTPAPAPTPTPRPVCSDADRRREGKALIRSFGAAWRRRIEGARGKVIARYVADPRGAQNVEASLGTVEFTPTFLKQCRVSIVSARYSWQVRTGATLTAPAKVFSVPGAKQFSCFRRGGGWRCP